MGSARGPMTFQSSARAYKYRAHLACIARRISMCARRNVRIAANPATHISGDDENCRRVPNNFKLLEFYSCASFFKLLFQFL